MGPEPVEIDVHSFRYRVSLPGYIIEGEQQTKPVPVKGGRWERQSEPRGSMRPLRYLTRPSLRVRRDRRKYGSSIWVDRRCPPTRHPCSGSPHG